MIEFIVFLWLILIIFIDFRVRQVEKKLERIEERLTRKGGNNESETVNS